MSAANASMKRGSWLPNSRAFALAFNTMPSKARRIAAGHHAAKKADVDFYILVTDICFLFQELQTQT